VLLLTAGLGAVKLLPMVAEFADYAPSQHTPGLPLGLLWLSAAGGGQHPDLSPPGLTLLHGGGWWEYAFFVGPLAAIVLLLGAAAARRCWPLVAIGSCFFVFAIDWPAPLAWLEVWPRLLDLPLLRTQRSPSRFLFLALFMLVIVGGVGLQRLWELARPRAPRLALALAAALTALIAGQLFYESLDWQRAPLGEPLAARDHRPHPLHLGTPGAATAELRDFAPNRLVYRASAERETRIVFPFRQDSGSGEWRVDGLPALSERGKLAVDVPPGKREIAMIYRPPLFHPGLGATAGSAFLLVAAGVWRAYVKPAEATPDS
jgi:hypothetical protein